MIAKNLEEKVGALLGRGLYRELETALVGLGYQAGKDEIIDNLLGVCSYRGSRFGEALSFFENSLKINPESLEARINLAMSLSDMGFYDDAIKQMQELTLAKIDQSIESKGLEKYYVSLAKSLAEGGLFEEAIRYYQKVQKLRPHSDIDLEIANLFFKKGDCEAAIDVLLALCEREPTLVFAYNLLGKVYFKLGQKDQARAAWERAIKLNPGDEEARLYSSLIKSWTL